MVSNKMLFTKDKWMVAEEIPDITFDFSQLWTSAFTNEMENSVGINYSAVISIHKGYDMSFHYRTKDSYNFGKHVLDLIVKNPVFGEKINKKIIELSDRLEKNAEKNFTKPLQELSDKQLAEIYLHHDKIHTELYEYGWLPNSIDMFHANFTELLLAYLKSIGVEEGKRNDYLVLLTTPSKKSIINQEEENLYKIASLIEKNSKLKKLFKKKPREIEKNLPKKIKKKVLAHWKKYYFLKFLWLGTHGIYTVEHYLSEIKKIIGKNKSAKQFLSDEKKHFQKIRKQKAILERKLKVDKLHRKLFDLWAEFMLTKLYRRNAQIKNYYLFNGVRKEIAKRLSLPLKSVHFFLPWEVYPALVEGKHFGKELLERSKFCVYFTSKGTDKIFTGEKAKKIAEKVREIKLTKVNFLHGQCGSPGKAKGKVKIINTQKDIKKMKKGNILVSIATNPDIVPAMKKASGIVTEQGGVTSHAAIVAREMNTPCLIGTKIATHVFKDNDLVEVNASKGIIKKLK
ncbi:MAG: PEP-utilizing enzyme [Candidatus Micrarchaeota archaeon]